jgi:hypothetical protein
MLIVGWEQGVNLVEEYDRKYFYPMSWTFASFDEVNYKFCQDQKKKITIIVWILWANYKYRQTSRSCQEIVVGF